VNAALGRTASLIVLFLVVTVGSACSGDDDAGESSGAAGATTSTTASTTTSTFVPITSTTAPASDRIEAVVARLLQARNNAFQRPDPAQVDSYLSSGCDCYAEEKATLENLQSRGWHWETPMFEVLGVRVADQAQPEVATLTVVARRPPERVVDAAGALVKPQGPGQEPTGYSFVLVQRDGGWRVGGEVKLDLEPAVLEQITREGVPS
jgi:hypothetical protein